MGRGKLGLRSERGRETFNLFCDEAFKQRGTFERREGVIVFITQKTRRECRGQPRNTRLPANKVTALDVCFVKCGDWSLDQKGR